MTHITREGLLGLLPIVADQQWKVKRLNGPIRNQFDECPICAIVNEINGNHQFQVNVDESLESLGLRHMSVGLVGDVMCAADLDYSKYAILTNYTELIDIRTEMMQILNVVDA